MYNKPIHEVLQIRRVKGTDLGIEVELEGENLLDPRAAFRMWKVVNEGSLRHNGLEFVTTPGLTIDTLDKAMTELRFILGRAVIQPSIRQSVHVHVNATDMTLLDAYKVIAAFALVEDMLVKANGEDRTGNLFCLRGRDAEYTHRQIIQDIKEGFHFDSWDNNHRYSALNLSALKKFGTFEFRFIKGLSDPDEIAIWARGLYYFVQRCKAVSSIKTLLAKHQTFDTFCRAVFTEEFVDYLLTNLKARVFWTDNENVPFVALLSSIIEKGKINRKKFDIREDLEEIKEFEPKPPVKKQKDGLFVDMGIQPALNWDEFAMRVRGAAPEPIDDVGGLQVDPIYFDEPDVDDLN